LPAIGKPIAVQGGSLFAAPDSEESEEYSDDNEDGDAAEVQDQKPIYKEDE